MTCHSVSKSCFKNSEENEMVQVDFFWSYALGAGLAMASSRQLENSLRPCENDDEKAPWHLNHFFFTALVYLAIFFAPSGIYLLWQFPSWETMHVGDRNLPAWIVVIFAITNVTQGILGFYVTQMLLRFKRRYLASLQMFFGYLIMFFILVHGWDGTGYRRFFSSTKDGFLEWSFGNIPRFFISDVALTLYGMGVILIPVLLFFMGRWIKDGRKRDESCENIGIMDAAKGILLLIFGGSLVLAIVASLLIHLAGWYWGTGIFVVLAFVAALRKGGYVYKISDSIFAF